MSQIPCAAQHKFLTQFFFFIVAHLLVKKKCRHTIGNRSMNDWLHQINTINIKTELYSSKQSISDLFSINNSTKWPTNKRTNKKKYQNLQFIPKKWTQINAKKTYLQRKKNSMNKHRQRELVHRQRNAVDFYSCLCTTETRTRLQSAK